MLTRKELSDKYQPLPQQLKEQLKNLLMSSYKAQLKRDSRSIKIFSRIYDEEFLLIVSLVSTEKIAYIYPITCFFSCDITKDKELKDQFNLAIDGLGIMLDSIFNDDVEFFDQWTHESFKEKEFYYKISREDIELTLKTNELLK